MASRKPLTSPSKPATMPPQEVGEPYHTKYRPKSFKGVVGQDAVVRSLEKALDSKNRNHTFLFTGGPGCGKTTLARIVADRVGVVPANLIEVDAASSGGIDVMREVMSPLRYQGFGASPNKAVIIDEAHMLSKQAWASLLKTVEEPPPHVYFFFCTSEAGKVPQNIQTRCLAYNLAPVKRDDLFDLLCDVCRDEGLDTPDKVLDLITQAAGGSPRQALVMLALVQDCTDLDEAAVLLASPIDNKEVIDLCRALIKGSLGWPEAVAMVKGLGEMPAESVRIVVINYLSACAMGARSDKDAMRALDMMEAFKTPYNTSDKMAPLLLSLGRVLFD